MRVLVVHNFYGSSTPSGENVVVRNETSWLLDAGHDVSVFSASNDDAAGLGRSAVRIARRSSVSRSLRERIDRFAPDVVHLHNVYPLLGPGAIRAAVESEPPVVWTIHNFRMSCLGGTLHRDGRPCSECPDAGSDRPGVVHGCYGNPARSALLAWDLRATRDLLGGVDRFVSISEYIAGYVGGLGVDAGRITTKYNSCPRPPAALLGRALPLDPATFLFAGRLHTEKGLALVLAAWAQRERRAGRLVIAGGGPLAADVVAAAGRDPSIEYVGLLDPSELPELRARTTCAVHPSVWQEPSGSIQESLAAARPVIATDVGAHAEVLDPAAGILCEPSVGSLAAAFDTMIDHCGQRPAAVRRMAEAAAARYEARYSPEAAVDRLVGIYSEVG